MWIVPENRVKWTGTYSFHIFLNSHDVLIFIYLFIFWKRADLGESQYDSVGLGDRPRFKTIGCVTLFKSFTQGLPLCNMASSAYHEELSSRLAHI